MSLLPLLFENEIRHVDADINHTADAARSGIFRPIGNRDSKYADQRGDAGRKIGEHRRQKPPIRLRKSQTKVHHRSPRPRCRSDLGFPLMCDE